MPHRSHGGQDLFLLRRDGAAPEAEVGRARRAIARLGKRYLRESYFTTFWLPRARPSAGSGSRDAAGRERGNPVEDLVRVLWKIARPPPGCAGAEWWIGRAYTNALPIGFHFDQDVNAKRGLRHPLLSSVFFFNRVRGGQLALTDQRAGPGGSPQPARAGALSVVAPRRNRYVVFPGDRFHGVLDAEGRSPGPVSRAPRGRLRVTLVINFWKRRPTGVPLFAEPGPAERPRTAAPARRRRRRAS